MNFELPDRSALLLMALGEYDHPPVLTVERDQEVGYRYVLQAWINLVKQKRNTLN